MRSIRRDNTIMNIRHVIAIFLWMTALELARWTFKWKISVILIALQQKHVHRILPFADRALLLEYSINWLVSLCSSPSRKLVSLV